MLRSAWFIARQEISFSLRQKETLVWTFVMPIVFFFFFGSMTAGFAPSDNSEPDALALSAPEDAGLLVDELIERLEAENFAVVRLDDEQAFRSARRRLTIPAAPEGYASFTAAVLDGQQMTLYFGREGESPSASFDQVRVARAVYGVLADVVVLTGEDGPIDAEGFDRLAAMPRTISLEVTPAGKRKIIPTGYQQTVPGTLVMFTMLILLTSGAILLVIERESGLLRRLASTPISRGSVVFGKWLGKLMLGLVQIAFGMVAGTVLFGMDWGDSLPAIFVILLAWAAFNAALGIVLGNLARSEAQMSGIGVLASLLLAALGGCWWPIEITPDWMQQLANYLPTGWTMNALHKLINFGYGPAEVVGQFSALVVLALATGWLGARTFRYQ